MKCERCEREIPEELYSITERGLMLSATGHWAPFSFCKSCKKELDSWFFEMGEHGATECAKIIEADKQNVGMCQQNVGEMSEKQTDGDLKAEIDKLPRIKVGNSNSPTVKYCIDERLLYEILEKMKGE